MFPALYVNELSRTARANWFALLAYLAFSGVTLLGVSDIDFFKESRQTDLPLIGVAIPTRDFFVFGPILGTALYVYFHLYLLKLWEALRDPPARPNGEALSVQVSPWLVTDFALWMRGGGAAQGRPLDWLSHLVTFLLVFLSGPAVIGYFWIRYWPAHELGYSMLTAGLFVLSLITMLSSLWVAFTRLRFNHQYRGGWWHLAAFFMALIIATPVALLTILKTDGPSRLGMLSTYDYIKIFSDYTHSMHLSEEVQTRLVAKGIPSNLVEMDFQQLGPLRYIPLGIARAQLQEAILTPVPSDWLPYETASSRFHLEWCEREGLTPELCGPTPGTDTLASPRMVFLRAEWCKTAAQTKTQSEQTVADCQLYFAQLGSHFVSAWQAEHARRIGALERWSPKNKDLREADMREAQMQGAYMREAQMQGADMRGALMQRAYLGGAQMQGADLSGAQMQGAYLTGAQMQRAYLAGAQMQRADLGGVQMQGADLREAQMQRADLSGAEMQGAFLKWAQMQGADLKGAQMRGADLIMAKMQGADLSQAQMQGADLRGAQMQGADLSQAQIQRADLWGSYFSGTSQKPMLLKSTNLSASTNDGGALRFVDLTDAWFDVETDFRNAFLDGSVEMSNDFIQQMSDPETGTPPCQWQLDRVITDDAEFYGLWRGWMDRMGNGILWSSIAPVEWRGVPPIPLDPECQPATGPMPSAKETDTDAGKSD